MNCSYNLSPTGSITGTYLLNLMKQSSKFFQTYAVSHEYRQHQRAELCPLKFLTETFQKRKLTCIVNSHKQIKFKTFQSKDKSCFKK